MRITSISAAAGFTGIAVAPAKATRPLDPSQADRDREARIAELQEQYRTGTYQVDARKTAAAILNYHFIPRSSS